MKTNTMISKGFATDNKEKADSLEGMQPFDLKKTKPAKLTAY